MYPYVRNLGVDLQSQKNQLLVRKLNARTPSAMRASTSPSDQGPPLAPPRRTSNRRRALILVDLSVEQMSAVARHRADAVVANCLRLVQAAITR